MSSSTVAGERGLRASLPSLPSFLGCALALALLLVACGGPEGSAAPGSSTAAEASAVAGQSSGDAAQPPSGSSPLDSAGDLGRLGGEELETAPYPVTDALAAEGGAAVASMLRALGLDPAEVGLALAVAPGGDPTISDWRLPGASADAILDAWRAAAPGTWTPTTLGSVAALAGEGLDGSTAWAVAADGRFVYIRTDDRAIAEEVAAIVGR